jgi:hypothetical protein
MITTSGPIPDARAVIGPLSVGDLIQRLGQLRDQRIKLGAEVDALDGAISEQVYEIRSAIEALRMAIEEEAVKAQPPRY